MNASKKWEVKSTFQFSSSHLQKDPADEIQKLLDILLKNRGLKTKQEKEAFLHPDISSVTIDSVGIDAKNLQKTIQRIQKAISEKEHIIVFGDYDVDGITGTAILWETLKNMGAQVMPYIPSRIEEGYGLSEKGIENVLMQFPDTKLIITVDNGIVASSAVEFANLKKIDVIVTDHHTVGKQLPKAFSIVHTTNLCGAGVAWMLSKELYTIDNDHLALVALATVADLVPLTGANRVLLTYGLDVLKRTNRPGIIELCKDAGVEQQQVDVYAIGHMLAPRLNAMGRIASAMDSLRLLCTKDSMRAKALAEKLGTTNRERQDLTFSLSSHAVLAAVEKKDNILFVTHETYDEGVIGLIAGRLVEKYYRPSIVLSIGKTTSKASARSIAGFNIIEFIRSSSHLLMNAGGHPMAAGFTIETAKIKELEKYIHEKSQEFSEDLLIRTVKIDCELPLEFVSQSIYDSLQQLQPFGMGNPEPTFVGGAVILDMKLVGKEKNHISFRFSDAAKKTTTFYAIAFGMGEKFGEFHTGEEVKIAYIIDENVWKERKSLQLKIKDIKPQK